MTILTSQLFLRGTLYTVSTKLPATLAPVSDKPNDFLILSNFPRYDWFNAIWRCTLYIKILASNFIVFVGAESGMNNSGFTDPQWSMRCHNLESLAGNVQCMMHTPGTFTTAPSSPDPLAVTFPAPPSPNGPTVNWNGLPGTCSSIYFTLTTWTPIS